MKCEWGLWACVCDWGGDPPRLRAQDTGWRTRQVFVAHADYAGTPSQTFAATAAVHKVVQLSAGLGPDAAFERQLKRTFVRAAP